MAATHSRRRLVLTTAAAAAVAVSLSACTAVIDGAAVAGDLGPCTHVAAPMLDVPASSSTEPRMRIPQPAGWERTTELEEEDGHTRLALSDADAAVIVMVRSIPDDDPATIFDNFHIGMLEGLEEEGLSADLTRTADHLVRAALRDDHHRGGRHVHRRRCECAAERFGRRLGRGGRIRRRHLSDRGRADHDAAENPAQRRDAEKILTGFEVLPQEATAA